MRLISLLFLLASIAAAQTAAPDVITLTTGEVIDGTVTEQVMNSHITVRLGDGSTRTIPVALVSRITRREDAGTPSVALDTAGWDGPTILPRDITIGAMAQVLDYRELVLAPLKSTEAGTLPGVWLATTTNREYPFHVGLDLSCTFGEETYDGSTQTGEPRIGTTNSTFFSVGVTARYTLPLGPGFTLTPFAGWRHRSWDREITGDGGIEEVYTWNVIPVGAEVMWQMRPGFSVGLAASADIMLSGTITILLSKLDSRAPDIGLTLGNVLAGTVAMPMRYSLSDRVHLVVAPYVEKYAFNRSTSYTERDYQGRLLVELHEPSSITWNVGMRAGLTFGLQ